MGTKQFFLLACLTLTLCFACEKSEIISNNEITTIDNEIEETAIQAPVNENQFASKTCILNLSPIKPYCLPNSEGEPLPYYVHLFREDIQDITRTLYLETNTDAPSVYSNACEINWSIYKEDVVEPALITSDLTQIDHDFNLNLIYYINVSAVFPDDSTYDINFTYYPATHSVSSTSHSYPCPLGKAKKPKLKGSHVYVGLL